MWFSPHLQTDSGYYYGYVYFRQTKDRTIRRGYFQKVSLCLWSKSTKVSTSCCVSRQIAACGCAFRIVPVCNTLPHGKGKLVILSKMDSLSTIEGMKQGFGININFQGNSSKFYIVLYKMSPTIPARPTQYVFPRVVCRRFGLFWAGGHEFWTGLHWPRHYYWRFWLSWALGVHNFTSESNKIW